MTDFNESPFIRFSTTMHTTSRKSVIAAVAATLLGLSLAGCHEGAPKGQVVATVNGQEITNADLAAEARAVGDQEPTSTLLQKVIARQLLVQDAHTRRLDSNPGLPADLARLRGDYLARLDLKGQIKIPPPPSDGAVDQFISSHPNLFANRTKLTVDAVRFHSADDLRSLRGLTSLDQVVSRLKQLNVQFERKQQQLDTAGMSPELAAKLLSAPSGQLVIIQQPQSSIALEIQARQSVIQSSEQQQADARRLLGELAEQAQVANAVNRLRASAHIEYQPGYQPSAPANTVSSGA